MRLPYSTLWRRELTRFFRQPSRIAGAVATPLIFWLLIGSGLSGSFRLPGGPADVDYLEYFFPGTIVLVLLFAAIFSNISVIEDRREGFLQGVLVAPVARAAHRRRQGAGRLHAGLASGDRLPGSGAARRESG